MLAERHLLRREYGMTGFRPVIFPEMQGIRRASARGDGASADLQIGSE